MKKIFLSILIVLSFYVAKSQYQSLNWLVGPNYNLNFTALTIPAADYPELQNSGISTAGPTAVVTDNFYNIACYYNNGTFYFPAASHEITLPAFFPAPSQPAYILGYDDLLEYNIETFLLANDGGGTTGNSLFYNRGYLETGTYYQDDNNITLASNLSSKMAVIELSENLVLTHELGTNNFVQISGAEGTYTITTFLDDVYYGIHPGEAYDSGFIKFTIDGEYFVVSSPDQNYLQLYSYDNYNNMPIDQLFYYSVLPINAVEFSAGNNYNGEEVLYGATDYEIYQFIFDVFGSLLEVNLIGESTFPIRYLQIGFDGKIYVGKEGDDYIGVIHNPEISGVDCFYEDDSDYINSGTAFNGNLPNMPANYFKDASYLYWYNQNNASDTIYTNDLIWFYYINTYAPYEVSWDFNDGSAPLATSSSQSHIYTLPGTYDLTVQGFFTVPSILNSQRLTKKVVVNPQPWESIIDVDTAYLCSGTPNIMLNANYNPDNFLEWEKEGEGIIASGATGVSVSIPGIYYLKCYDEVGGKLVHQDTAVIIDLEPSFLINAPAGGAYPYDNISFEGIVSQEPSGAIDLTNVYYNWSWGDGTTDDDYNLTNVDHSYSYPGTYSVTLSINYETCTKEITLPVEVKGDLISPNEIELCPSGSLTLTANYDPTKYFVWKNNIGTVIDEGVGVDNITITSGGQYTLEIYDGGTLIDSDVAVVFELNANINTNAINYSTYNNIFFSAIYDPQPYTFVDLDTLNLSWDFGDGEILTGFNKSNVNHHYLFPGTYTYSLNFNTNECFHSLDYEISIETEPAPVTPNTGLVCDGNQILFEIIDEYQGADFSYNIYINYEFYDNVTTPFYSVGSFGEYQFEILQNSDTVAYDSVTVFQFTPSYTATGNDAMPSTIFDINENINFISTIFEEPYSFISDFSDVTYIWTIDGNVVGEGYDFFDTTFSSAGVYDVNLNVEYDGCLKDFSQQITITDAPEGIIFPQDTIKCSFNDNVILSVGSDFEDNYIKWTDIVGSEFISGVGEIQFEFNEPGEYIAIIYTDNTPTNILYMDTARIYWFDPVITVQNDLITNSPILFNIDLNSIPENYNYFEEIYIDWDMGDASTYNDLFLQTITHTYSQAGTFNVSVNLNTDQCFFNTNQDVIITNDVQQIQITPSNPFLCDPAVGDFVELQVTGSIPNNSAKWYRKYFDYSNYSYEYEVIANDTNKVLVNRPAMYFVEVTGSTDTYYDSVWVDYKICNNYDASLSINGDNSSADNCLNDLLVDFEINLTELTSQCSIDFSTFDIIWDFGDGITESNTGYFNTTHTYPKEGQYLVSVYLFDNKNCEKLIRKRVNIYSQVDTTIVYQLEEFVEGDIEINISDITGVNFDFNKKSTFISYENDRLIPANSNTYSIDVSGSKIEKIVSPSDVMLFVKLSQIGDVSLTLKPPVSGTYIEVVGTDAYPKTYIFGRPNILSTDYSKSLTNTYILTVDEDNPIGYSSGDYLNELFSPDSVYSKSDFYYFNSGYYKSEGMYNAQDELVNGTWELIIENNGFNYGKLEAWGLIFKNDYFYTPIQPDSIVCFDQFGTEYNVYNNTLSLNNSGVSEYNITCYMRYPNSDCEVVKNITVLMPEGDPVPHYFSPNGDGINDNWLPVSPEIDAHIVIIDKNGNIIKDYMAPDLYFGWDGTSNGKSLPSDSYWYIITLPDNKVLKGTITIVR